jgi:hypothetical protein
MIEGYGPSDSYILMLEKYLVNKEQPEVSLNSEWGDIFNRAVHKASLIIVGNEKKGVSRELKTLDDNPLKIKYNSENISPLFSNIYAKRLTFSEKVEMKYKEMKYKYNNSSKAINETVNFFGIDYKSKSRLRTLFDTIQKIEKDK